MHKAAQYFLIVPALQLLAGATTIDLADLGCEPLF
jgi:hypothetical protein